MKSLIFDAHQAVNLQLDGHCLLFILPQKTEKLNQDGKQHRPSSVFIEFEWWQFRTSWPITHKPLSSIPLMSYLQITEAFVSGYCHLIPGIHLLCWQRKLLACAYDNRHANVKKKKKKDIFILRIWKSFHEFYCFMC